MGKVKRKRGPENGTDVRGIYTQAGGETENFALSSSEGGYNEKNYYYYAILTIAVGSTTSWSNVIKSTINGILLYYY